MDVLLSLIRAGRIVPISAERDVEVIRSIFPCIDIYSLQMFVHIYRNKGYSTFGRLRPATEKLLFSKVPCSEEWKNAGVGSGENAQATVTRAKVADAIPFAQRFTGTAARGIFCRSS